MSGDDPFNRAPGRRTPSVPLTVENLLTTLQVVDAIEATSDDRDEQLHHTMRALAILIWRKGGEDQPQREVTLAKVTAYLRDNVL